MSISPRKFQNVLEGYLKDQEGLREYIGLNSTADFIRDLVGIYTEEDDFDVIVDAIKDHRFGGREKIGKNGREIENDLRRLMR